MHQFICKSFTILFIAIFSFGNISFAADRELAADGDQVRLTINSTHRCGSEGTIKITTSSAAYFDQDAATIQRLSDTARAILSFECPKISKIQFIGYTDGTVVFKADAEKESNWALQTEPAPLERLALFFSLNEPDFFYLDTVYEQLEPYRKVSGMSETYQFKAYKKEVNRLIAVIDGDTEKFRSYLKNPGRDFGNFEKVLAHYKNILRTIEKYAPEQYPAYNKVYVEVSSSLKNDYWTASVAKLIEDDEKTVKQVIADAAALTKSSKSSEFGSFVDGYLASWINEEASFIKDDLADAPLYEIAWVSEYLAGFPDLAEIKAFPKTKTLIQQLSGELIPLIAQRIDALQLLAIGVIQETGTSYENVDTILETGFALAEEFENAGYTEQGRVLISTTIDHIDKTLKSDLQNFKNQLSALELTKETVAALQEQALEFSALSNEFNAFSAYKDAVENVLDVNKSQICENILKEAGVNQQDYKKQIAIGNAQTNLSMLACDLFENQHIITEFSQTDKQGAYILAIDEVDGTQSRFLLKPDNASKGKMLRAQMQLHDKEIPISEKDWEGYIAKLVLPPPDGKPDANGVRECDRLAADPNDPKKLATGVDYEKDAIDSAILDRAIDACIAAVEHDSKDTRQHFQLGRVLWYAGDHKSAGEYIKLAADAKYTPALYYQAEILLGTSDDPNAFIEALEMFKASSKGGYSRADAMIKELNPQGISFFKDLPSPTSKNIVSALSQSGFNRSIMGISVSARVVDVKIKECFQISSTDFSCEYKKILKCDMLGGGNDPMFRLISAAFQADCNTTEYTFGTFRKIGEGKWKELSN